jgi:hypothetical protein
MSMRRQLTAAFLMALGAGLGSCQCSSAQDSDTLNPLDLADLEGYRAALAPKLSAKGGDRAEPTVRASSSDLLNRPDQFRGHRVTVSGRIVRIFRQGSVGTFPPLAEIWIASTAGEPFCLIAPQERGSIPLPGQAVQFTGTFLRLIRYEAKRGNRLAPLVVGDRPPLALSDRARRQRSPGADRPTSGDAFSGQGFTRWGLSASSWALGLALAALAGGVIVWQHLRAPPGQAPVPRAPGTTGPFLERDHPLEFIEASPFDPESPVSNGRNS